jgi:hypothetical protein
VMLSAFWRNKYSEKEVLYLPFQDYTNAIWSIDKVQY